MAGLRGARRRVRPFRPPRCDRRHRAAAPPLLLDRCAQRLHLALERRNLTRLRLHRRNRHARIAVEIHGVAALRHRRTRCNVVDDEAEVARRRRAGDRVLVRREAELEERVMQPREILRAQILDVRLVGTARDRTHSTVGRIAGRALQEAVTDVAGVAGHPETRAGIAYALGGARGYVTLQRQRPAADGRAAGVKVCARIATAALRDALAGERARETLAGGANRTRPIARREGVAAETNAGRAGAPGRARTALIADRARAAARPVGARSAWLHTRGAWPWTARRGAGRRDADTGVLARPADTLIRGARIAVVTVGVRPACRRETLRGAELVRVLARCPRPARFRAALAVDGDEAPARWRGRRARRHAELIREARVVWPARFRRALPGKRVEARAGRRR